MENKECCKWCDRCMITDLENNEGTCYWDIGEHVDLTDDSCSGYIYNDNLDRCQWHNTIIVRHNSREVLNNMEQCPICDGIMENGKCTRCGFCYS